MTETGLSLLGQISDPLVFIGKLGGSFAHSGMFGCKTEAQGHVLAMHCVMEGVSPLTIMQTYHFIEGKLSMRADAMLGRFVSLAGGSYKVVSRTPDLASVEMTIDGKTQVFSLAWSDAQKEPFTKGKDGGVAFKYSTPRSRMQMLWCRVISDGVRTMAPQVVCGAYTPEELEDPDARPAAIEAEAEVIPRTAAAESMPAAQSPEPAKRTRKPKEPTPEPQCTPEPKPVESDCTPEAKPAESATESVAVVVASADAASPAATAPAGLPKIVTDIIELRDYVGPRWPKGDFKNEIWPKVFTALKVPEGQTDEERFTKADEATRQKLLTWLNGERVKIDKLATSTDLNAFANQTPTTSAK